VDVNNIISQVNRDVEESYDTGDVMDWINRCSDDLTPIAKLEGKTIFTIDNTNSYTLPDDFHDYAYVVVDGSFLQKITVQEQHSLTGYLPWGNQFSIENGPASGTITLYYYKKIPHVTGTDESPAIETEYHDLYILYGRAQIQFTEEEYDRPDSMGLYESRKREYQTYRIKKRGTGRVRSVV
jgi:hypothetical protein